MPSRVRCPIRGTVLLAAALALTAGCHAPSVPIADPESLEPTERFEPFECEEPVDRVTTDWTNSAGGYADFLYDGMASAYSGDERTTACMALEDADLRIVLELLAKHVGINLIIPANVRGTYTGVAPDAPWQETFDTILASCGYKLERVDMDVAEVYRVVER